MPMNVFTNCNQSTFSGQSKNIEFEQLKPLPKYDESLPKQTKIKLHNCAWDNTFGKSFELGMYWNFTMGWDGSRFRPIGCPGLDEPFLNSEGIHYTIIQ